MQNSRSLIGLCILLVVIASIVTIVVIQKGNDQTSVPAPANENEEIDTNASSAAPDPSTTLDPYFEVLAEDMNKSADEMLAILEQWSETLIRIKEQVRQLETETLEETLTNYHNVEMFYWPGSDFAMGMTADVVPVAPDVGGEEVKMVLSNRRTSKLIEELSGLAPSQAGELVSVRLRESLHAFRSMYASDILNNPILLNGTNSTSGFTFRINDLPDGSPSFQGLRKSIFGLVLIAGTLGLHSAGDAVLEVAEEAARQRDDLLAHRGETYDSLKAVEALTRASLYNRQILSIGIGAIRGTSQSAIESSLGGAMHRFFSTLPPGVAPVPESPWHSIKLSSYQATISPFDMPASRGPDSNFYLPPDYSLWEFDFKYAPLVDDEAFEEILNHALDRE